MKRYIKSTILDINLEDDKTRVQLASNPNTYPELLSELAEYSLHKISTTDDFIKWRIALNDSTPLETLELLLQDESLQVVAAVFCNPKTPLEWLDRLSYEQLSFICCGTKNTPNAVLLALTSNRDAEIAEKATTMLHMRGIDV